MCFIVPTATTLNPTMQRRPQAPAGSAKVATSSGTAKSNLLAPAITAQHDPISSRKFDSDNFQTVQIQRKEDVWPSFKAFLSKDRAREDTR